MARSSVLGLRRRLAAYSAAALLLAATASCGGSRDTALSSATDALTEQVRVARDALQAGLDLQRGRPADEAERAVRRSLTDKSSAGGRAIVDENRSSQTWRVVALYEAQRPYSQGFTSEELLVAGCVEYVVSLPDLELASARPTDCPERALVGIDETVRVEL